MKMLKRIFFLVTILLCITSIFNICFAQSEPAREISESGKKILRALSWFGYATSLVMLIFIGMKYMTSSVDAKANMKTAIVSWVLGAFLVFMASTITLWVINAANLGTGNGLANQIVNEGLRLAK